MTLGSPIAPAQPTSHPVDGDACVSIGLSAPTLLELIPSDLLQGRERATLNRSATSASDAKYLGRRSLCFATDSTGGPSEFSKPNP